MGLGINGLNYGGNRLLQRGTLFESRTVVRLGLGEVFPKEKRAEEAEKKNQELEAKCFIACGGGFKLLNSHACFFHICVC